MTIPLWAPVLLPIFFGVGTYALPERFKLVSAFSGTGIQLAVCLSIFLRCRGTPMSLALGGWEPPVGIMLYADRFAGVLIMLTALLFLMLMIYEISSPSSDRKFYMLFLILEGLLCGIFLLDDLFSIFVMIEVSTIVVSLLIMFRRDNRSMYDGLFYMIINIFTATFLLLGLAMLYKHTGTFSFQLLGRLLPEIDNTRALYLPYALIMTAVCLKAALMPLFAWLPKAHGTPSSPSVVSAVLSGLYVKSGIYLFIRCQSALGAFDTSTFFLIAGIVTALIGAVIAIAQSDIKLILSYHTVSQLGLIMIAVNMSSETATWGGIYHIVNHAVFKSGLFLGSGIIIEEYGTRDIYKIKGVFRRLPFVSAGMIAATLGITGAPLFNGSISKYLITYDVQGISNGIMVLINIGTLVSFIKFSAMFFGGTGGRGHCPANRTFISLALGAICLALGVFGAPIIRALFGVDIHIDATGYFIKSLLYLLSGAAAWSIYRFFVRDRSFWQRVRGIDFGFNASALSVVLFFLVLTGYLFLV